MVFVSTVVDDQRWNIGDGALANAADRRDKHLSAAVLILNALLRLHNEAIAPLNHVLVENIAQLAFHDHTLCLFDGECDLTVIHLRGRQTLDLVVGHVQ